jgi:hypothetical protein
MDVFRRNPVLAVVLVVIALGILIFSLWRSFGSSGSTADIPTNVPTQPATPTQPDAQQSSPL